MRRIKSLIDDEFKRNTAEHIRSSDLPDTYSTDGKYIYKLITNKEYIAMLESPDGVHMVELGISATLDTEYDA